jgi:HPt (histidine-containing phosphotransfer) domain-containing protein
LNKKCWRCFRLNPAKLLDTLAALPAEAGALAHTLKGSARAIGAFAVAEAATRLEAELADGNDPAEALAELGDAVALARSAIEAVLRRS